MITEQEFKEYERVRKEGTTNMVDFSNVAELTGLSEKKIGEIVKNYNKYKEAYQS